MKVTIIRHGKVNHVWKKKCSSAEFDEECRLYDMAPIDEKISATDAEASKIYISTLDRSYQTAKKLFGERDFLKSELISEVPLRSAFETRVKFPTWFWNFSGRMQWLINSKRQPESRKQTLERARLFTRDIIKRNENCALITHGFFMHTLISVMKRYGFKPGRTSTHYKNGEKVIMML